MPWEPPSAFDGITLADLLYCQRLVNDRANAGTHLGPTVRSGDNWVGHLIAERCGLDADDDRKRINAIFKEWCANGAFRIERIKNLKGNLREAVLMDTYKGDEN